MCRDRRTHTLGPVRRPSFNQISSGPLHHVGDVQAIVSPISGHEIEPGKEHPKDAIEGRADEELCKEVPEELHHKHPQRQAKEVTYRNRQDGPTHALARSGGAPTLTSCDAGEEESSSQCTLS